MAAAIDADSSLLAIVSLLGYLLAGAIGFVSFYATAESILVFLDIEENTRATRTLTQKTVEALGQFVVRQPSGKN